MKFNPLTPEEKRVIEEKGTESPHSGEYDDFFVPGVFACRRCGALLYRSENKFEAHCGWPSFDEEVLGAVNRSLDADGRRTEIACRRCGAHLGHLFGGEKFTPKDRRHCVNSLSLKFIPREKAEGMAETIYFGAGCFWCAEAAFQEVKGVISVRSGYAGGTTDNPDYESVSTGKTGHVEVVEVKFDPTHVSLEALLDIFFSIHDPTTLDRQGADIGTQYRSIILYTRELQKEISEKIIVTLNRSGAFPAPIVTEVKALGRFYPAEEYHQNYFRKHPEVAYCQAVVNPKISKLRKDLGCYLE